VKTIPPGPGDWNGSITTAGSYDPYTGNGKRAVDDIVVPGSIGAYPLKWTRVWNSRGGGGSFGNSNWWGCYTWGMWTKVPVGGYIDGEYEGPQGEITYPDGRRVELQNWSQNVWVLLGGAEPMDRLVYMGNYNYDLVMRDGGRVRFIASGPPNANGVTGFSATAIIDPYGQMTTIGYDSQGRGRITEPGGRYLQFNTATFYTPGGAVSADLLSSVQAYDPSGNLIEMVTYHYTGEVYPGVVNCPFFYLTSVDYEDGSHAYYTYYPAGQMDGSPWHVSAGSMKSCDDIRYAGAMKRIRYEYMAVSTAHPEVAWGQIKAEKNWDGQTVSEIEYPAYNPYQTLDPGWRKEYRGDGAIRTFQYTGAELSSYTDFLNHISSIAYSGAPNQWSNYLQTFTDARGNVTTSEKEQEAGQVIRRTNPDGTLQTFAYEYVDGAPYYLQIRGDELGRNTYFTRDGNHRVTKIWYGYNPNNLNAFPTEEFSYNNFGQVLSHKTTTGGTEYFEYDNHAPPATRGLKTKHTDPLGNTTRYEYYQSGANADRLYRIVDPRGNSTWYEYNQRGQVTKLTHQDGSYIQSGYNADGTMAWTSDELGHTTGYTYDEYRRVLTVTNALNETTTNDYGLDGASPLLHTTNNPKRTLSPTGKSVVYEYDANRRKTYQGVALGTPDAAATTFEYDAVGNLTRTTDPRGNAATFGHDNRNRQITATNALNQTTSLQYDGVGNKVREMRPDGAFRTWEYEQVNPMNRLVKSVDWRMSTSEVAITTTYDSDATGDHRSIVDSKGAVYGFDYDDLGRKIRATYPVDATGVYRSELWVYDTAGNLMQYWNPAGPHKSFTYDNRNRMTDSSWDVGGPSTHVVYDAASRMTSISTNNGETTVAFGYDAANRKIWEDQTVAGYSTHGVVTPSDADGNRQKLEIYTKGALNYGPLYYDYTQRGQLARIKVDPVNAWFTYRYDASGNLIKRQDVFNGVNDSTNVMDPAGNSAYDGLNRPLLWEQTLAGDAWFTRSRYQYDKAGREVATWRDEDGKGERFGYDVTNQVTNVSYKADQVSTGSPTHAQTTQAYLYTADKLNRQSVTENGALSNYVTSGGMNQYTQWNGQTIQYDGNFNFKWIAGWQYSYDAENHLTGLDTTVPRARFVYDGLGRCVKRTVDGVTTLITYDGWKPVIEWEATGNVRALNIYGPGADEILYRYIAATNARFRYHSDHHGNVIALLDWNGNRLEKYSYDVFGVPTAVSWTGSAWDEAHPRNSSNYGNRFLFQGREYFPELGLYDYRHRFYDPYIGRFIQTDPTGFDAGDMNLFRYCGNDPVDGSDPMGLEDIEISDQLNKLGIQASLNSRQSFINHPGLGTGSRGQLVQENNVTHRLSLQGAVLQGYIENVYGRVPGSNLRKVVGVKVLERYPADTGYAGRGVGHAHDNLRGAKVDWSSEDWALARGAAARPGHAAIPGRPVWKTLTSDGSTATRLTPQRVPGQTPTQQTFSTKGVQPSDPLPPTINSPVSGAQTAAEIDASHQATGVPSQGAEAVNHVRAYNL
jgi:RHS repeat-associated protein